MNVDSKIISKALSEKLKEVLPDLISSQQAPYIWYNGNHQNKKGGFLVTMDIEKAFDSSDHNFLIGTLEKYGFGQNIILWIKILVND